MTKKSENINELMAALAKAQGKIISAKKDKQNPFFKSSYADLSSVWDACRQALSENGLAIVQTTQYIDSKIEIVTTLGHSSGQWIESCMPLITTKMDPQSIGSALTYYRRYALSAMVGVAASEEDDDGNSASGRDEPKKSAKMEPIKQPRVDKFKADELAKLLGECESKYQNQVMAWVKNLGFPSLSDIDEDTYGKIKVGALRKREEALAVGA
jgi:hypothetical protein